MGHNLQSDKENGQKYYNLHMEQIQGQDVDVISFSFYVIYVPSYMFLIFVFGINKEVYLSLLPYSNQTGLTTYSCTIFCM